MIYTASCCKTHLCSLLYSQVLYNCLYAKLYPQPAKLQLPHRIIQVNLNYLTAIMSC